MTASLALPGTSFDLMKPQTRILVPRDRSPNWDRHSLRSVIEGRASNPKLSLIAQRRQELAESAPYDLHGSYDRANTKAHEGQITPRLISIPPRYGTILYLLATRCRARFIIEAGSGFGISTMYLALAAENTRGQVLSYEIADYASVAQNSASLVSGSTDVRQQDFNLFSSTIDSGMSFDFAFVDARHDLDSLIRSFRNLRGWLTDKAMIVFDDIGYSDSSREGWRQIVRIGQEFGLVAMINDRLGIMAR